ncbi:MAG TPA: DNA polymerase III subunit chi [Burkholderiales bacterium]|nr:DNA polymerase III subunit chi [Burkholderiales bacterium]
MTSIDFYFNAEDRLTVACRLAGKALQKKNRVLIYAPQPEIAQRIDRLLWTAQAVSFLPHCAAHDPLAADTPLLIAVDETPPGAACEVLLNLSSECPPFFERHERLLEIVAQADEERHAGRARFKFYRDRGYAISNHDLAKGAS